VRPLSCANLSIGNVLEFLLYSVSEVGLSIVLYMRSLLLVESFDLRPSNQYILVRVNSSSLRLAKMCLCQVSLLSRCSPRDVSLRVVNVTWTALDPLAFIVHV
jgi:hypothetical protein